MKLKRIILGIVTCMLVGCYEEKVVRIKTTPTPSPTPTPTPIVETMDPSLFTDVNSLLLVANKSHPLPTGYAPSDLVAIEIPCTLGTAYMRTEASSALTTMANDAEEEGVYLMVSSAFRDEDYQASLYYGYVNSYGADVADTISSRPGYSDHQTGLACDFVERGSSDFTSDFEDTASGQWLAQHAHEYGFIMRYPKDKAEITGYDYEPWHFRYIGIEYATKIFQEGMYESFEEYFDIEGGDYK